MIIKYSITNMTGGETHILYICSKKDKKTIGVNIDIRQDKESYQNNQPQRIQADMK